MQAALHDVKGIAAVTYLTQKLGSAGTLPPVCGWAWLKFLILLGYYRAAAALVPALGVNCNPVLGKLSFTLYI